MRMIKMQKKQNSDKRGMILVTVIYILAMAMIFISCALLMTTATRSRVYDHAESSQARVTVTSAVEAFYQALQMQEVTDTALEAYASGNKTVDVIMTASNVPGMYGATDNKTTATFGYDAATGYVVVDFETTIGETTEAAQIILKESPKVPDTNLFTNQVDYVGNLSNNFRGSVGSGAPADATDNNIIFRGSYHSNQSQGTVIDSDMIFVGNDDGAITNVYFENNEVINGDAIFLDGAELSWSSTAVTFNGDLYFIGTKSTENAFTDNPGNASRSYGSGSTWTFANRKANASTTANNVLSTLEGAETVLFLNSTADGWSNDLASDLTGQSSYEVDRTTWVANYSSGSYISNVKKAQKYVSSSKTDLVGTYPTVDSAFADLNLPTTTSGCTNYTTTTLSSILSTQDAQNQAGNAACLQGGYYLITGDTSSYFGRQISGSPNPIVVFLDGSSDYVFYLAEDIKLEGVIFAVVNPSTSHKQVFVLANGCTLTLNDVNSGNTAYVCAGLLSMNRGYTSAQEYWEAFKSGLITMADCDRYYDGVSKPTMYVYGAGSNTLNVTRGTAIEAYIGLFDSDYSTTTSYLNFYNGSGSDSFKVYGRLMATNFYCQSADFKMPYCPNPNSSVQEEYDELASKYSVVSVTYYGGNNTIEAEDSGEDTTIDDTGSSEG